MPNNIREEQIESEVARIEQSTLSANEYIQRYGASFSLIQFYRYRDKLSREGIIGLRDKLQSGNHQKLNSVEIADRSGFIKSKPNVTPLEARLAIADEFGTQVHRSTMSRILKRLGVIEVQNERQVMKSVQVSHVGFELIAAMAIHLGWPSLPAQCIMEVVEEKRLDSQQSKPVDKTGRNSKGQFTGKYNKRPSIRKMRFASIELKRSKKELQRMDIFNISLENIERKALAILA
jgi:transposase